MAKTTCNTAVHEAAMRLTAAYTEFDELKARLGAEKTWEHMDKLASVGHWGMGKGHEVKPEYGIAARDANVFFGQGENIEGSLYTAWDGTVLRNRWLGHVALYIGTTANYVSVDWNKDEERWILEPCRLNGEQIREIGEDGVLVHDATLSAYEQQVMELRWAHEDAQKAAARKPAKLLARLVSNILGTSVPEIAFQLPQAPVPVYRSAEDVVVMMEKMREGLALTIDILSDYAREVQSTLK